MNVKLLILSIICFGAFFILLGNKVENISMIIVFVIGLILFILSLIPQELLKQLK